MPLLTGAEKGDAVKTGKFTSLGVLTYEEVEATVWEVTTLSPWCLNSHISAKPALALNAPISDPVTQKGPGHSAACSCLPLHLTALVKSWLLGCI